MVKEILGMGFQWAFGQFKRLLGRVDQCKVKDKIQNSFIVLCYSFISILVFRRILLQSGVIGFRHDWSIPIYKEQLYQFGFENFYSWLPRDLGINPIYPADFLLKIMFGFFSQLGLGGEVLSKGFSVMTIFLSGLFMYYLCRSMKYKSVSSFIAGIFYMLTPVIFNRIVAGQVAYLAGYTLSPLVIAFFIRSVENHRVQYRIVALGGLVFAFASVQIQFLIILFALLLIYSLFRGNAKELMVRIKALSVICAIVLLIHAFWLLPLLSDSGSGFRIGQVATLDWIQAQSPSLIEAWRLTGFVADYFQSSVDVNSIPKNLWIIASFLIPIVAFSAIILKPRDKRVVFFTLIATIALFLAKGVNAPLGNIFTWLFWNVSLTVMFREVYHLMVIPALAFAVLLCASSEAISNVFYKILNSNSLIRKLCATMIPVLLLTTIFISSWPIFTGDFDGNIQVYNFKPEYREIYQNLLNDKGDFRVLWLPMAQPMTYLGLQHAGLNPLIAYSPKPALGQFFPAPESAGKYADFLQVTLSQERTAYIGRLLSFSNTKYVIFSNDFESKLPQFVPLHRYPDLVNASTNEKIDYLLDNQVDIELKEVMDNATIRIYKNKEWLPHLYAVDISNSSIVAGDLSSFVSTSYAEPVLNNDHLLFFISQMSPSINSSNLADTVIIQDNQYFDYVFSFIPTNYKIDPGNYALKNADPQEGWTRTQSLWWYNWYYSAGLEESAFTQIEDALIVPFSSPEFAKHEIWTKVYFGKLGSSVEFFLDNTELGKVNTKTTNDEGFKWVYLGSVAIERGEHKLLIKSGEGENVVARIVVAPSTSVQKALKTTYDSLQGKNVALLFELEKSSIQEINKTNITFDPKDWLLIPQENSRDFKYTIEDGMLVVTLYFDGDEEEDEGLLMWKSVEKIDLKKYPYIGLNYHVQDPTVQTVQVSLGIDYTDDGTPDKIIHGELNQVPAPTAQQELVLNAYEIAKKNITNKEHYNLVEIGIHPQKIWGVDSSTLKKGEYAFYLNKIRVFGLSWIASNQGFNASQGFVLRSMASMELTKSIYIPKEDNYEIYLRADARARVMVDENTFNMSLIGNQDADPPIEPLSIYSSNSELKWYTVKTLRLQKGNHNLSLIFDEMDVNLDQMVIKSVNQGSERNYSKVTNITYRKINPTKYIVYVNTSRPFFLAFSESYHPLWQASIDGEKVEHFEINSFANGYYVNKIGNYVIILEFTKQRIYEASMAISFATIITLIIGISIVHLQRLTRYRRHGTR